MRPALLVMSTDACRTAWDAKLIKKSVIERKLAPFFPGAEEKANNEMEECPICFLVRRRLSGRVYWPQRPALCPLILRF